MKAIERQYLSHTIAQRMSCSVHAIALERCIVYSERKEGEQRRQTCMVIV